jgi:hypothetical protein
VKIWSNRARVRPSVDSIFHMVHAVCNNRQHPACRGFFGALWLYALISVTTSRLISCIRRGPALWIRNDGWGKDCIDMPGSRNESMLHQQNCVLMMAARAVAISKGVQEKLARLQRMSYERVAEAWRYCLCFAPGGL